MNKNLEKRIDKVISEWPLTPTEWPKKKIEVLEWFENFQPSEHKDMFSILEKIKVISSNDIEKWINLLSKTLQVIFGSDISKVRFHPLGNSPSASGANFLYTYRKALKLSEESFPYEPFNAIDLTDIKALVFVDDLIGSGNQATRFANKTLKEIKIDKYYVTLLAFKDGLEKVKREAGFTKVITAKELSKEFKAFSPRSCYFSNPAQRERLREICRKYGKKLYPAYPLGYDNSQSLFVFPHNVPNNILPIIWAGPQNEEERGKPGKTWRPLFERIKIPDKPSPVSDNTMNIKKLTPGTKNESTKDKIMNVKNSEGTFIQANGDVNINYSSEKQGKKPVKELLDTLAEKYKAELEKKMK